MNHFRAIPAEDQSEINLSPMLDAVFILLIFFVVIASFVREQGLPVTLQQGFGPPDVENATI